jgi:hypothetical protein
MNRPTPTFMTSMPEESVRGVPPIEALPDLSAVLPDEPLLVVEQRNASLRIDNAELWRDRVRR